MVTSVYNINQMPPTKNYPRPLASNSVDSSKKPVITQPIPQPIPQPVHFPAPPPQFVPNGRPVMGI